MEQPLVGYPYKLECWTNPATCKILQYYLRIQIFFPFSLTACLKLTKYCIQAADIRADPKPTQPAHYIHTGGYLSARGTPHVE